MRSYESYHHFDEDIHEAVARAASDQDKLSFAELADHYNLDDAVRMTEYEGRPIQSVTFTPEGDYDETHAQVYHVPFAISLDPNTLMRLMRQHAANPSEQLTSYSNPGTIGQPGGKLKPADLWHIARTHDLSPTVAPQQADLASRGITSVDRLGYSAGTLQALTAMEHDDSVETRTGILVEPVAVAKQGLLKLASSFMGSGSEVWNYINQTDSRPYTDVRSKKILGIDTGLINYSIGIGRATNLVSAREMARGASTIEPTKHFVTITPILSHLPGVQSQRSANQNSPHGKSPTYRNVTATASKPWNSKACITREVTISISMHSS